MTLPDALKKWRALDEERRQLLLLSPKFGVTTAKAIGGDVEGQQIMLDILTTASLPPSEETTLCETCMNLGRIITDIDEAGSQITAPCPSCAPQSTGGK